MALQVYQANVPITQVQKQYLHLVSDNIALDFKYQTFKDLSVQKISIWPASFEWDPKLSRI